MILNNLKAKISYLVTPEIFGLLILDCILLPLALFSAVWLRLGAEWDPKLTPHLWLFFSVPLWTIPVFINFGLYRAVIKYLDDKVVYVVFAGVSASILILTFLIYFFGVSAFPRTSIVIYGLLALVYIGGSRFLLRGLLRSSFGRSSTLEPVAIYGAGEAGVQLTLSLAHGSKYVPLFFVDDDESKWGSTIRGIKVYSPQKLHSLSRRFAIKRILLAIPSSSISRRREIIKQMEHESLYVQTLPGINDIISGDIKFSDLKNIEIEDLLGREMVPPNVNLLRKNIQNKNVLVTGAGGSIGSELARQIAKLNPQRLVILDSSEFALYSIDQELKSKFPYLKIIDILGSVTNSGTVNDVMQNYKIDTIYHAAAYKHVPIVELNPLSGLENNVLGTLVVANAAVKHNVANMILISTDKAVRPTNVMGASKRLAELILQSFASKHKADTIFSMVRFGNVLGSSGSVVPLFKQQIKQGGPVTVTHPDIIRYFMTIPEAVELVIQSGSMAKGGEVFVLDMGQAVKIVDLARKMIYLSGLTIKDDKHLDGDIEIRYMGLRPGEKLFEELLIGNNPTKTEHNQIMMANEPLVDYDYLMSQLDLMQGSISNHDSRSAISILKTLVNEYTVVS
ncbi:MAG TPA: nucleoside-diphosphate sugar epimerase/dehydratase [Aquella sp.]|nr:nucleoside-diphosphate sugar epimerase/dehydratase [Aquella sp.]